MAAGSAADAGGAAGARSAPSAAAGGPGTKYAGREGTSALAELRAQSQRLVQPGRFQAVAAAGDCGRSTLAALVLARGSRGARCTAGADSATAVESSPPLVCAADSDSPPKPSPSSALDDDPGTAA